MKQVKEMKIGERGYVLPKGISFDSNGRALLDLSKSVFPDPATEFPELMIIRKGPNKDDYAMVLPLGVERTDCSLRSQYDQNNYAVISRVSNK